MREPGPDALDMARTSGHFLLESGHHSGAWLDVDQLFIRPQALIPHVQALIDQLAVHQFDAVCGPLVGGGILASMIAAETDVACFVSERTVSPVTGGLFTARYAVPTSVQSLVAGRRIAVVDDVISAGSATRATIKHLRELGGRPVALAALITAGPGADGLAEQEALPLYRRRTLPGELWDPSECPACRAGSPLTEVPLG